LGGKKLDSDEKKLDVDLSSMRYCKFTNSLIMRCEYMNMYAVTEMKFVITVIHNSVAHESCVLQLSEWL